MSSFYVYALFRDDGRIFYVGKGSRKRCFDHARPSGFGNGNPHRDNIIRQHLARGSEIVVVKIREGLSEEEAFVVERAFIAAIGRGKRGPLVNLTDGGEGFTGARHSSDARKKLSAAGSRRWKNERYREEMAGMMREVWERPEHRSKLERVWSDPEYRARMSENQKRFMSSPESRKRISETQKKVFADPAYHAHQVAVQSKRAADPIFRKKQAEDQLRRLADPVYRAKLSDAKKRQWADPAYRAMQIQARREARLARNPNAMKAAYAALSKEA